MIHTKCLKIENDSKDSRHWFEEGLLDIWKILMKANAFSFIYLNEEQYPTNFMRSKRWHMQTFHFSCVKQSLISNILTWSLLLAANHSFRLSLYDVAYLDPLGRGMDLSCPESRLFATYKLYKFRNLSCKERRFTCYWKNRENLSLPLPVWKYVQLKHDIAENNIWECVYLSRRK